MNETILYKKTRTGAIQQWKIWVEEKGDSGFPELWVEFGQVDGKKQTTFDVVKEGVNQGKLNETTALEQAGLMLERKVTKQIEEGYKESVVEAEVKQEMDWDEPFDKALTFFKPKNSIDIKKLNKLEKDENAILTVKRDGMACVVRKTEKFGVEIYSRRMDLSTEKYPHLISGLEKLNNGTILLGEIVLLDGDNDCFNSVSRVCRSDPEKAIERQKELGKVSLYIYDLAFYNFNNTMISWSYSDRQIQIDLLSVMCESKYILPVERINKPHEEAMEEVKERGLEGLVVWQKDGKMKEGECFTTNGKAYRPNVLWKLKNRMEGDFIARFDPENEIGEWGTGKHRDRLKSVFLYQLDDGGNEVYISKCGGGFSDKQRTFFTTAKYPCVFKVLYDSVQKDGSIRFPVFDIERHDKSVDECFMDEKIKEAMKK